MFLLSSRCHGFLPSHRACAPPVFTPPVYAFSCQIVNLWHRRFVLHPEKLCPTLPSGTAYLIFLLKQSLIYVAVCAPPPNAHHKISACGATWCGAAEDLRP
jgi:hypothetical protein